MDKNINEETVTIPKWRYDILVFREQVLAALDRFGVENWELYSDAMATLDEYDSDPSA